MTFPARQDKDNGRFAKTLKKFVAGSDGAPGVDVAKDWLERWEN